MPSRSSTVGRAAERYPLSCPIDITPAPGQGQYLSGFSGRVAACWRERAFVYGPDGSETSSRVRRFPDTKRPALPAGRSSAPLTRGEDIHVRDDAPPVARLLDAKTGSQTDQGRLQGKGGNHQGDGLASVCPHGLPPNGLDRQDPWADPWPLGPLLRRYPGPEPRNGGRFRWERPTPHWAR